MSRKQIFIILIAAAGFCFVVFENSLRKKSQGMPIQKSEQRQINNQKQDSGKDSGSIDLERPPFLDE